MKESIEVWMIAAAERSSQSPWWVFSEELGRFKLAWIAVYRVLAAAWLAAWMNEKSILAEVLFHLAKKMVFAINAEFPIRVSSHE